MLRLMTGEIAGAHGSPQNVVASYAYAANEVDASGPQTIISDLSDEIRDIH